MSFHPLLDSLNREQREAVTAPKSAFINAGPGTGKTHMGASRVGWRIAACHFPPRQVLALTFTRRAARQFHERLTLLLGPALASQIRVATFHSFALAVVETARQMTLGERIRLAGHACRLEILEELVREELKQNPHTTGNSRVDPSRLAREVAEEIGNFRVRGLSPDSLEKTGRKGITAEASSWPLAARLYPHYLARLEAEGLVELDGLIPEATEWFGKLPLLARTLGVREVLMDETQDTSPAQLELLLALLAASHKELGVEPTLVGVGDERQQIFAYLNASPYARLYQNFPSARRLSLDLQYRFGPTLTGAANRVSWSLGFDRPLRSARSADDPEGEFGDLLEHCGVKPGNLPVLTYQASDEVEEASFIAEEVGRVRECRPGAEVAVLARTRRQCERIGRSFEDAGIDYRFLRSEELSPETEEPAAAGAATAESPVIVSTIHAAKGAEFEVVFVAGLAQGLFPVSESRHLEELRLFFVAVTRAKHLCYLTHPARISRAGGERETGPSWFLQLVG